MRKSFIVVYIIRSLLLVLTKVWHCFYPYRVKHALGPARVLKQCQ